MDKNTAEKLAEAIQANKFDPKSNPGVKSIFKSMTINGSPA